MRKLFALLLVLVALLAVFTGCLDPWIEQMIPSTADEDKQKENPQKDTKKEDKGELDEPEEPGEPSEPDEPDEPEEPEEPEEVGLFSDPAKTVFSLTENYTVKDADCDENGDLVLNLENLQLNNYTLDLNGKKLKVQKSGVCTVKIQNGTITNGALKIDVPEGDIDFTDLVLAEDVTAELSAAPDTVRLSGVRMYAALTLKGNSRLLLANSVLEKLSVSGDAVVEATEGTDIGDFDILPGIGNAGSVQVAAGCRVTAIALSCSVSVNIAGEVQEVRYDADAPTAVPSLTLAEGGKLQKLTADDPIQLDLGGEVGDLSLSGDLPAGGVQPIVNVRVTAIVRIIVIACPIRLDVSGNIEDIKVSENLPVDFLPEIVISDSAEVNSLVSASPLNLDVSGRLKTLSLSADEANVGVIYIRITAILEKMDIGSCPADIDIAGQVGSFLYNPPSRPDTLPNVRLRHGGSCGEMILKQPLNAQLDGTINNLSADQFVLEEGEEQPNIVIGEKGQVDTADIGAEIMLTVEGVMRALKMQGLAAGAKVTISENANVTTVDVYVCINIMIYGKVDALMVDKAAEQTEGADPMHIDVCPGSEVGSLCLANKADVRINGIVTLLSVEQFVLEEGEEQPNIVIGEKGQVDTADIGAEIMLTVEGVMRALNMQGLAAGAKVTISENANVTTVDVYVCINIMIYGKVDALMVDKAAEQTEGADPMYIDVCPGSEVGSLCLANKADVRINGIVTLLSVAVLQPDIGAPNILVGDSGELTRAEIRAEVVLTISGSVAELFIDENAENTSLSLLSGAKLSYLVAAIENLLFTAEDNVTVDMILFPEGSGIEIPVLLVNIVLYVPEDLIAAYTVHHHTFVESSRTESTCQTAGSVIKICICGETKTEELPLADHSYVQVSETLPTCNTQGERVFHCAYCEESKTVILEKVSHVFEITERKNATCTENGYVIRTCTLCQATERVDTEKTGHRYELTSVTEVTCTQNGEMVYTCKNCADTYTVVTLGEHSFVLTETVAPTCVEDGYQLFTCEKCLETKYVIMEAGAGHQYVRNVVQAATTEQEGIYTYECSVCHDTYTVTVPCIKEGSYILLIQDSLPWTEDNNVELLNRLVNEEHITGWDMMTSAELSAAAAEELEVYAVIYIANDQSTSFYRTLNDENAKLVAFAQNGGTLVYGACDSGWQGGNIDYALPGGVTKYNRYSLNNYIYDGDNYIVTGELTDYMALTDALLVGTYCSHTAFDKATLPEGSDIILTASDGSPTLVQFNLGEGNVILSGLTWEFYYHRSFEGNTTYSKSVYDDLLVYALALTEGSVHIHEYDLGVEVQPTCTSEGGILHTCTICGKTYLTDSVPALGHQPEEVKIVNPTCAEDGYRITRCALCGEEEKTVLTALGHQYNVVITAHPTSALCGSATATCEICGDSFGIILPVLVQDGKYEITEWTAPDCVTDGVHAGIYTYRDLTIEAEEIIEKLGHDFAEGNCVCSRCSVAYHTFAEDSCVCSVCGKACHTFVNGICSKCGEQSETKILVIKDKNPWGSWGYSSVEKLMNNLIEDDYISSYKTVTTSNLSGEDLSQYAVIFIADEQSSSTYNFLNSNLSLLANYVSAGGTLVYGTCYNDSPTSTLVLPGNVYVRRETSNNNYIVDSTHPIVTGELTDGTALTNAKLIGSSCSHTYFVTTSIPENANIILKDSGNRATLIEYSFGNGTVIASGLTWEFYYGSQGTYADIAFDDLIVYATTK